MAQVQVSEEQLGRLSEFKQVVRVILDEEITFEQCVELVLEQGLKCMLADILGSQEQVVLLESLKQLSLQYPAQVYGYVADALRRGAVVIEKDRVRWQMGIFPDRSEEGIDR